MQKRKHASNAPDEKGPSAKGEKLALRTSHTKTQVKCNELNMSQLTVALICDIFFIFFGGFCSMLKWRQPTRHSRLGTA